MELRDLLKNDITEKQRAAVLAVLEHGSQRKAAKALGIVQSTVSALISAAKEGTKEAVQEKDNSKRIKELERLLDVQAEQIERMRKTNYKLPAGIRVGKSSGSFCRLVVPDTHGSVADPAAISALLGDLEVIQPAEVVMLGDHLECGGFLAQHHTLGYVAQTEYSFEEDVSATNQLLDVIQDKTDGATIDYIEGNHECVTPEHEVLTTDGWVPIPEVTTEHTVATMNDAREVEWQKPLAVVSHDYDDDLVVSQSNSYVRFAVTKKHRFWLYSQVDKLYCVRAGDIIARGGSSTFQFPMSIKNPQPELCIDDCDIQLAAWILTDGCLTGKVSIFQSKERNFETIRGILGSCGVKWSETTRHREPPSIDGVQVKATLEERIFNLSSASSRNVALKLFGIENYHHSDRQVKEIPYWVSNLSQRQFAVFLESLIDGDGTRVGGAYTLYGKKEFLDKIQALLFVNGYRASLAKRYSKAKKGHFYCLNITKRDRVKVSAPTFKTEKYAGKVYCLTMKNDNFVVRYRGIAHVTGNSRIEKWCVTQAVSHSKDAEYLRKLFSTEAVLHLEKRGIRWIRQGVFYDGLTLPATIKKGHCYFTHGNTTARHAASVIVSQFGGNVVFGHTHRAQTHISRNIKDGIIGAWNPGCLCKIQPLWQHTNPTTWSHGYGLQLVNTDGSFLHINVPIIDGKSYLEPLAKAMK